MLFRSRNLEFIPLKIGYQGSLKFSQPRADFAEKGPFSQPISQPISQLRNGVPVLRNGTRVPRGVFAEGGVRLRNLFLSGGPFSQPNLDFAEAM